MWGPSGAMWADCVVRDLSNGGAKLQLKSVMPPGDFRLLIVELGFAYDATPRWRREQFAGVKFTERYDLREAVPADLEHVRDIWKSLSSE